MSNTIDLNNLIATASDIFNGIAPLFTFVLAVSLVMGVVSAVYKFGHGEDLSEPSVRDLLKQKIGATEAAPDPEPDKPKNDGRAVIGIGDDGELVFEDDKEPRYMRRIE